MNSRNGTEQKQRLSLTLLLAAVIFCFFLITMVIITAVILILIRQGVLAVGTARPETNRIIFSIAISSVVLGTVLSAVGGRIPLRPVNKIVNAMNQLAKGDFKTRLHFQGKLGSHPTIRELSDSFNTMAAELENTELLRSDFVNNFSHEFKTPIVSIAGFASLLKRGNLTELQKQEYVDVIEKESLRLADMATNVLNLSKVESQEILTDISVFNLSEQIRSCVLLLERKWERKHIELDLDFNEYQIEANAELLKQVWINLIDNAVKFAPEYGLVRIRIAPRNDALAVVISNTGDPIPADKLDRVFQKFYQADESHATEGNGIGLAIVKKVVELHQGTISAESSRDKTSFTVVLPQPKNQTAGKE